MKTNAEIVHDLVEELRNINVELTEARFAYGFNNISKQQFSDKIHKITGDIDTIKLVLMQLERRL